MRVHHPAFRLSPLFFFSVLVSIALAGCSKKPAATSTEGSPPEPSGAAKATPTPAVDKDHQVCFMCEGKGVGPCRAPGCVQGKVECTGPCMRLSKGKWEHRNVAGHSPDELWQAFRNSAGGTTAWSQAHVGEVVVMQNGNPMNTGKCQQCGGTTRINCPVCGGKAQATCEFCEGKKIVPANWTANDNPVLNRQPDLIRLKDGRVLLGRVATRSGSKYTIRTRDGKMVEVEASEILPKTNTVQRF